MTDMPEIHKLYEKTKTNFKTKKKKQNKIKQKTSEIACEETRRLGTNFSKIVKYEFPSGSKLNNYAG